MSEPILFRCRRCHAILGEVTPAGLTVGKALLTRLVTLICQHCGASRKWVPQSDIASPTHPAKH